MKNRKNGFAWILCLAFFFFLTGCVNADVHITIQKDGSGIYQIKVLSNEWMLTRLAKTKNHLREQGFRISEIANQSERGWIATKRVSSVLNDPPGKSLRTISRASASAQAMEEGNPLNGFEVRNHLFTTTIAYRNVIDLTDQIREHQANQWFLEQVDLQFHLTTPIKARKHNATSVQDEGKTLTWNIDPTKPTPIQVVYRIPNPITWSIIVLTATVGLIMAIIFRFRRRKRKKRTGDSQIEPPVSFRWDDKK